MQVKGMFWNTNHRSKQRFRTLYLQAKSKEPGRVRVRGNSEEKKCNFAALEYKLIQEVNKVLIWWKMKKFSGKDTTFKNLRFDRVERRKGPKSQNQKPGEEGRRRGVSIRKVLQMQTDNSNDQNPRRDSNWGKTPLKEMISCSLEITNLI